MRENIEALKKQNVQTVFTIATTSKKEIDPYLTPIRKNEHFAVCGCIIFEHLSLIKVIEIIDGLVDYIFVDNEKNILLQNFKDLKSVTNKLSNEFKFTGNNNLSDICFARSKSPKFLNSNQVT